MPNKDVDEQMGFRRESDRNNVIERIFSEISGIHRDLGETKVDTEVMKSEMRQIKVELTKLVTRMEFTPVKLIAYGIATVTLSAVLLALVYQVVRHA